MRRAFFVVAGVVALAGAALVRRRYTFARSQVIAAPIDEVYAFFSEPRNLGRITPPWLGFTIEQCSEGRIALGSEIAYTVRLHGVPVRWKTLITGCAEGVSFADTQVSGPYRSWVHTHTFEAIDGGTMTTDRIEYELPFGLFGVIAHELFVRRDLERIFAYRQQAIASLFAVTSGDSPARYARPVSA